MAAKGIRRQVWELAKYGIGVGGLSSVTGPIKEIMDLAYAAQLECPVASALMKEGLYELRPVIEECVVRTLKFERDLKFLDELLNGFGPVLLIKGGGLRFTLYPDPSLRQSVDIDILVTPSRWDEAANYLIRNGSFENKNLLAQKPLSIHFGYERVFTHPRMFYSLELHRYPTEPYRFRFPTAVAIGRALRLPPYKNLLVPNPVDSLLISVIHFAQRGFKQTLKHALDFHLLCNLHEDSCTKALQEAEELGFARLFNLTKTLVKGMEDDLPTLYKKITPEDSRVLLDLPFTATISGLLLAPFMWDSLVEFLRFFWVHSALRTLDRVLDRLDRLL